MTTPSHIRLVVCSLVIFMVIRPHNAAVLSGTFQDWLKEEEATAAGKAITAGHSSVNTVEVCLQEVADRNCRCVDTNTAGACLRFYVESRFACCLDDHDHNSLNEQTARVQCIFIEDYFSEAVAYEGTAAAKVGIFTATCTVLEAADKCHHMLSEGMTLSVTGSVMRSSKVAFLGTPVAPNQDSRCKAEPEGPLSRKNDFSNTGHIMSSTQASTAVHTSEKQRDCGRGGDIYTGSGDIYTGRFQVTKGHSGGGRSDGGQFQLVYVREVNPEVLQEVPAGYFAARPYGLQLDFFMDEEHPHPQ